MPLERTRGSLSHACRRAGHVIVAFLACAAIFSLALAASSLVSREGIRGNVEESFETLEGEGLYPRAAGEDQRWRSDNYTTAFMLNIAYTSASGNVRGTFAGSYFLQEVGRDPITSLGDALSSQTPGDAAYARYWHGWLVFVRPLLLVLNLMQIRQLLLLIVTALITLLGCLLYRCGRSVSAGLVPALAMAAVCFPVICLTPAFSFSFVIALAASCVVCADRLGGGALLRSREPGLGHLPVFFFVLGAVTVYLDFLDNPIVTLGLPLGVYLFLNREETGARRTALLLVACCALWGVGYLSLWAAKWVISSALTGQDVLAEAFSQVELRVGNEGNEGEGFTRLDALIRNFSLMFPAWSLKVLFALAVACAVAFVALLRTGRLPRVSPVAPAALVLVALLPYAWYLVLSNHSYIHWWFTWRNQAVTVFCLLLAVRLLFPFREGCPPSLPVHDGRRSSPRHAPQYGGHK